MPELQHLFVRFVGGPFHNQHQYVPLLPYLDLAHYPLITVHDADWEAPLQPGKVGEVYTYRLEGVKFRTAASYEYVLYDGSPPYVDDDGKSPMLGYELTAARLAYLVYVGSHRSRK